MDEDLPDSVDDNDNSDNDNDNDGVGIDEDNNDDDEAGEYVNTSRLASPLQGACSTRQENTISFKDLWPAPMAAVVAIGDSARTEPAIFSSRSLRGRPTRRG